MQGLKTDLAPSKNVVLPHFKYATISFFVLALLMVLSASDLAGHYFQPSILSLTHIAALGWGTMIIFGALYQLIPVIMETALFSERIAKINFWILGTGIFLLIAAFWHFSVNTLLPIAASVVFIGLILFILNITLTAIKATKKNIQTYFIVSASFWLFLTGLLGTLISFNYRFNFMDLSHLHYLKIHAHMGMLGWFLLLIIGVGSLLLPMFFVSHKLNIKKIQFSFFAINGGLIGLTAEWWIFNSSLLTPVFSIIIVTGILSFISYIYDSYKKRMRKSLDTGMKFTVLSISLFLLPIFLGIAASFHLPRDTQLFNRLLMLYGFGFLMGFISSLILGQTYKTLPFIIWLDKYKDLIGKTKTPMPRELYSEKISSIQYWSYVVSILLFSIGIIFSQPLILKAGSYFLLICAIAYNINIFKILSHKPVKEKSYEKS